MCGETYPLVLRGRGGWMMRERSAGAGAAAQDCDEGELAAFAEFTEAQVAGRNPDVAEHLAKYPQYAERLRPVLESAVEFYRLVQDFKREFPGFSSLDLVLPRRK